MIILLQLGPELDRLISFYNNFMKSVKITDLPNGPWREYALEAQRRGLERRAAWQACRNGNSQLLQR